MVGLIITNSYRSISRYHLWSGRSFPPAPCVVQFGLVGDLFGNIEEKMFLSAHSHSIWINKKYYILLYFILCNNFRGTQKHTHILIKSGKVIYYRYCIFILYPVKNSQLDSHFIWVCSAKVDSLLCINEHHQVQCLNPKCITTLEG